MSLSLSNLLNPTPDSEASSRSLPSHRDALNDGQHDTVALTPPEHAASSPRHPSTIADGAMRADGEVGRPKNHDGDQSSCTGNFATQQAGVADNRGIDTIHHQIAIQLPPPSPTSQRKLSSPLLEQYHVSSRDARRASAAMSPTQDQFTLPPLHMLTQPQHSKSAREFGNVPSSMEPQLLDHASVDPASSTYMQETSALHPSREQASSLAPSLRPPSPSSPHVSADSLSKMTVADEGALPSPAIIKQEQAATPQPPSPIGAGHPSDGDHVKAVATLKNEHGLRTQSPLRESSIPVPSTESATLEPTIPKKRPAPSRTKKGTATTMKKTPAAKRRKTEAKKDGTPAMKLAKAGNNKGTPANSSPAPSARSASAEFDEDDEDEEEDEDMDDDAVQDDQPYCICRKPDTGTFMIGCDACEDWFHGKCVGIREANKNLINEYICPNCTRVGARETTWKRMCRREGCNEPARTQRTKSNAVGSKYCSDECGVLFFRQQASKMRGREHGDSDFKGRSSSRKKSSSASVVAMGKDLGARGGVLAPGELKALLDATPTLEEFRKLGSNPTHSPPASSDRDNDHSSPKLPPGVSEALQKIADEKDKARRRHAVLKDRIKFVSIAKTTAIRVASEKDLKVKDFCGYDRRLEWSDEEFVEWRDTGGGKTSLEKETTSVSEHQEGLDESGGDGEALVCDRKRCMRHNEWQKLAIDSLRHEISENSDHMRAMESEEAALRERAVMARLDRGEGQVEVHAPVQSLQSMADAGDANGRDDKMDIDNEPDVGTMEEAVATGLVATAAA